MHNSPIDELTKAEINVCKYISKGYTHRKIARLTKRSPKTINNHVTNIYKKLNKHGVNNAARLGVFCVMYSLNK